MNIDIPNSVIQECIDAGIIQTSWSINSTESRSSHTQRLTYNVGEYVVAKVQKVFNSTKRLS